MVWLIWLEELTITKKIGIRKVETEMFSDAIISQIATLSDNDKHVTLEVSVQLKKNTGNRKHYTCSFRY